MTDREIMQMVLKGWEKLDLAELSIAISAIRKYLDQTPKDELAGTIPISNGGIATRTPLSFIAPPTREWVGLEIEDYAEVKPDNERAFILGARWAEAKLKEKNT